MQRLRRHLPTALHLGVFLLLVMLGLSHAQAQIEAYDFTGVSGSATPATYAATLKSSSLDDAGTLTRGAGAAASVGTNSFRTTGFKNDGISTANTDYFQFTLSATSGNTLSLTSIDTRVNGTGTYFPVSTNIAYSTDGTNFTLVSTAAMTVTAANSTSNTTPTTFSLSSIAALQNLADTVTVTFRYYASGSTATGGFGFYSAASGQYGLAINGTITPTGAAAANQYFDLNGTTAGSGIAANSTNTFSGTHFNSVADGTGTPGAFTNDGTATATFSAGTDSAANTYTVNIDQAVSTLGITFKDANVTLAHAAGGSITLTGASVNVATGTTATISEAIGGTVGLTKDGAGTLTLSGTNGYTGSTTIDTGILSVSSDANLGASTNGVVLNSGTLQTTTGFSTARAFTGTGSLDIAPGTTLTSTGVFNTTGVTLANTGTLSITNPAAGQGIGNVTFNATATVANTGSALAVGNVTVGAGSTGVATISGPISLATGAHTFAVPDTNTSGVDLAISGAISGAGGISKATGAGTLALNGNNSFSGTLQLGGTTVTGGTISVGNANALGSGPFNFNDGTVSNDTGAALSTARVLSIGATGGTGIIGGATFAGSDITVTGGVSFYSPAAAVQVVTVNNHTTFTGVVSTGSAASTGVTVNGTGTLTLTGTNTFVQPLIVTGATVEAANTTGKALGANTALTVNGGGTLLFSAVNQALTTAPVNLNVGTISIATGANQGSGATLSGGVVSGTSTVGLGALTLAGNSTVSFLGASGTAVFTSFAPGSFTLNVTGSGFGTATDSADGSTNRLIFNMDLNPSGGTNLLTSITFNGVAGAMEVPLDSGFYEIEPLAAVPEPATLLGGALLVSAAAWSQRRRLRTAVRA